MIREAINLHALPGLSLERSRVAEVKLCPCGGSLAGKLLQGWETGSYPGQTVLECTTCGRREAIVRRMIADPRPKKNRNRRVEETRVCERVVCGKPFHPKDYHSRQRYCSVDCGNKDRRAGQAPMYYNAGVEA